MQIAGSHCTICNQSIALVREGTACTKCQLVFHRSCVADNQCGRCGQPLVTGQQAHAVPNVAERIATERPINVTVLGRLAYLSAALSIIRVLGGLFGTGDAIDRISIVFEAIVTALLAAWLGWGLLNGRELARRFYLWATPPLIGAGLVVGDDALARQGLGWLRIAIGLAVYAPFAFALTRARTIAFFKNIADSDRVAA
jgi:hypothetical protein